MEEGELKSRLATNLRQIRKERKWSQLELAVQADLSEQTILSIEIKRLWPSEKTLIKILNALNIDIATLFRPEQQTETIQNKQTEKVSSKQTETIKNKQAEIIQSEQTEKLKAKVVESVSDLINSQIRDFLQNI